MLGSGGFEITGDRQPLNDTLGYVTSPCGK
jgi:hypothetical protein